MSSKDNGGPAFGHGDRVNGGDPGMSLRDYFAAKAMHAELNTAGAFEEPALALVEAAELAGQTILERIAFNSYAVADAMLAERAKGGDA